MRTLTKLSIAVLGLTSLSLTACSGGNKTEAKLEAACNGMADMAGEKAPKGACKCMSSALVASLSPEDAEKVATAFSAMKKPEDAMVHMMPLLANDKIMIALGEVDSKCDMK